MTQPTPPLFRLFRAIWRKWQDRCRHHWHLKEEQRIGPDACQRRHTDYYEQCCNCGNARPFRGLVTI